MSGMSDTPATVTISTEDLQKIQTMANSFSALQEQLAFLQEQVKKQGTPARNTPPLAVQEPMVANPELFDGTKHLLDSYTIQVNLVIQAQPSRFSTERQKVLFAASFLRGPAAKWFQPLFTQANPPELLDNFPKFMESLNTAFGGIDDSYSAVSLLTRLNQSHSVANYAAEFKRLAPLTKWNDEALTYQFYQGLKNNVKDELARCPRPATLYDLVSIATNIDNRIHERITERNNNQPRRYFQPITKATAPQTLDRMEIDSTKLQRPSQFRGPLTAEERQHRITNKLCLYCGQPNHIINTCPFRTSQRTGSNSQISTLANTSECQGNDNTQC